MKYAGARAPPLRTFVRGSYATTWLVHAYGAGMTKDGVAISVALFSLTRDMTHPH